METIIRTTYYDNGNVKSVIPYIGRIREGLAISYYPNGVPKSEVEYHQDKISGKVKTYYADGSIESFETYIEGARNNDLVVYSREGRTVYPYDYNLTDRPSFRHF